MTKEEIKNLSYEKFVNLINNLTESEFLKLCKSVGYPVFNRLCMGELKHKFILLQDGAAAIIQNQQNQILLQHRSDRDKWGLPGGCQELGETFEETVIREVKEETNLDIKESDLQLLGVVSGNSRKHTYPNGDTVFDNTVLYLIKTYTGTLKWNDETKEMKFFDIDKIPSNLHDKDLIDFYIKVKNKM